MWELFLQVVVVGERLAVVELLFRLSRHDFPSEQSSIGLIGSVEVSDFACSLERRRVLSGDVGTHFGTYDLEELFSLRPFVLVWFNFSPICKRCSQGLTNFVTRLCVTFV